MINIDENSGLLALHHHKFCHHELLQNLTVICVPSGALRAGSPTGAELLFEVFSQRYERGSTIVTSNLPFEEWTSVFGAERLTGALLDRLTHHVHILSMNGDSYRLTQSARRGKPAVTDVDGQSSSERIDPDTGEITTR